MTSSYYRYARDFYKKYIVWEGWGGINTIHLTNITRWNQNVLWTIICFSIVNIWDASCNWPSITLYTFCWPILFWRLIAYIRVFRQTYLAGGKYYVKYYVKNMGMNSECTPLFKRWPTGLICGTFYPKIYNINLQIFFSLSKFKITMNLYQLFHNRNP